MSAGDVQPPHSALGLVVARDDPHGVAATALLDAMCRELSARYGRPPSPFVPGEAMVVARLDGDPVGCGALRGVDETTVEIKRVYVIPAVRRRGVAARMLTELERLAGELGYARIILETGVFQPEAIALYHTAGYKRTEAYGRYIGNADALCFGKDLVRTQA